MTLIAPNPITTPKRGILGWAMLPFAAAWTLVADVFWGLASIFGIQRPLPIRQHEYIDTSDVDLALAKARNQQSGIEAVDAPEPADVVLRYAAADPEDRATIDLSALTPEDQDWLTGVSDRDLTMIAVFGRSTAARSLEHRQLVTVIPREQRAKSEPAILQVPEMVGEGTATKGDIQIIREGFLSAVRGYGRSFDYRLH